ncbi:ribbon-helix-helix domain-containing protein [Sphingobium sp. MK2]|jgi:predicted transcriptional regulator|uniref:ribbon-helix-helix domain-containing protein n=1 Tax=Sphingobium sp. MK2 TaxID=3116540 RepID=UPI0032E35EC9
MRFLADIPDEDVKWLDQLAREQGKSRAAVLREAVSAYRPQTSKDWLQQGFGAWARNGVSIDPHEYERARRAEWTRPWDDDYDEVRAASPEYFTEEDDKERAHYLALTKKAAETHQKNSA